MIVITRKVFIGVLSMLWTVLCLAGEDKNQITAPDAGIWQQTSSTAKVDLTSWQTVIPRRGIKFKLPADWQHEGADLEQENQYFTTEATGWHSPDQGLIRIIITTFPKGFVSLEGRVISTENALEEKLNSVTRSEKNDPAFSDVRILKIGGVRGVFRRVHIDFKDKETGERNGIIWTGYRIYQRKAQEVDINMSAHPQREELLQVIFNTIEVDQDNDVPAKR